MEATEKEICLVMRTWLWMRYRKVIPISMTANSPRNLVLRQQFALRLFEVLAVGKRVINVDETLLGQTDFRRRKWMAPSTSNSVAMKAMRPRLAMIVGLCTRGAVYLSIV